MRLFFFFILFSPALCLAGGFDQSAGASLPDTNINILSLYHDATQSFRQNVKQAAIALLLALVGLQFLVNGAKKLIKPNEFEGLVSTFVMSLISATFFIVLIESDWIFIKVIEGFTQFGRIGSGMQELTPDSLLFKGIETAGELFNTYKNATGGGSGLVAVLKDPFTAFFLLFIQIVIIASFAVMAAQLVLAMIGAYFWVGIIPVLLGFGGLSYTRDMAITAIKGGIAIGVKLMTIYVVASVSVALAEKFGSYLAAFSSADNSLPALDQGCWSIAFSCAIMAYLSMQIPKLASDLLNGQSSLTAGDAASNAMIMGAGIAAGATTIAGMATSGAASLEGLRRAASASMNSAGEYGKTGAGAALHAGGQMMRHGGSVLADGMRSVGAQFSNKADASFGGQVAESINSSMGGSMSPTNPSAPAAGADTTTSSPGPSGDTGGASFPGAGAAPGISGTSASTPSSPVTTAAMSAAQHSSVDAARATSSLGSFNSNLASTPSSGGDTPGVTSPGRGNTSAQAMGDASGASVTSQQPGNSYPPEARSLAETFKGMSEYLPPDQHTVGVNANLGTHHDE